MMRIISKVIVWGLSLILVFIITNILIWSYYMKGVGNYISLLNNKDRSETISQITITNIESVFSIFSVNSGALQLGDNIADDINIVTGTQNIDIDIEEGIETDIGSGQNILDTGDTLDPYDPTFEEEFNSFFGGENNKLGEDQVVTDTGGNRQDENLSDTGKHAVGEALIQRFNE